MGKVKIMNHKDGSVKVVLTAVVVNFFVTIAKSVGWVFSMSPSMLAEAIHSFADTANQLLVYLGIRISRKGPIREYPAGGMGNNFNNCSPIAFFNELIIYNILAKIILVPV